MKLYKTTPFSELACYCHYTIHVGAPHYYVGTSMGRLEQIAVFWHVTAVWPVEKPGMVMVSPQHFSSERTFKLIVYEKEQREAYQEAFERRALRQILESILGHPVG